MDAGKGDITKDVSKVFKAAAAADVNEGKDKETVGSLFIVKNDRDRIVVENLLRQFGQEQVAAAAVRVLQAGMQPFPSNIAKELKAQIDRCAKDAEAMTKAKGTERAEADRQEKIRLAAEKDAVLHHFRSKSEAEQEALKKRFQEHISQNSFLMRQYLADGLDPPSVLQAFLSWLVNQH